MAKLLASAAVMWVNHTRAVQIPRWYGYMRNHPVERHVRGASGGNFERGGEVQRMVIVRALLAGAVTRL